MCVCVQTDSTSDDLQTGFRVSPSKRTGENSNSTHSDYLQCSRRHLYTASFNPVEVVVSPDVGSKKNGEEIDASCSAFLFVLTCIVTRESCKRDLRSVNEELPAHLLPQPEAAIDDSLVYWPGEERIGNTFTATRREVLAALW